MWTKLKVVDVKCVDDGENKGIHIACGDKPPHIVTLVFDKAVPHEVTDNLVHLLREMHLSDVIVQTI